MAAGERAKRGQRGSRRSGWPGMAFTRSADRSPSGRKSAGASARTWRRARMPGRTKQRRRHGPRPARAAQLETDRRKSWTARWLDARFLREQGGERRRSTSVRRRLERVFRGEAKVTRGGVPPGHAAWDVPRRSACPRQRTGQDQGGLQGRLPTCTQTGTHDGPLRAPSARP